MTYIIAKTMCPEDVLATSQKMVHNLQMKRVENILVVNTIILKRDLV
jgi:hypothetical protein